MSFNGSHGPVAIVGSNRAIVSDEILEFLGFKGPLKAWQDYCLRPVHAGCMRYGPVWIVLGAEW